MSTFIGVMEVEVPEELRDLIALAIYGKLGDEARTDLQVLLGIARAATEKEKLFMTEPTAEAIEGFAVALSLLLASSRQILLKLRDASRAVPSVGSQPTPKEVQ